MANLSRKSATPSRSIPTTAAFSLAELVVVLGIIALLIAVLLPPLQAARRQAMQTHCAAQLGTLGQALEHARSETRFYPRADDQGAPIRFTWIDLLIQARYLNVSNTGRTDGKRAPQEGVRIGYCPADRLADLLNSLRHPDLLYPLDRAQRGVDYSFGISIPLSQGAWAQSAQPSDGKPRRHRNVDRNTATRVLVADAYATGIYNLTGGAEQSGVWNAPTQYDNTVAWGRHVASGDASLGANILYHDGHAAAQRYDLTAPQPVNTAKSFVWQPNEPLDVNPETELDGQYYPSDSPPSGTLDSGPAVFPLELVPAWYTRSRSWTRITHK